MTFTPLRIWVIPALLFHVAVCIALWRVQVPIPGPDRPRLSLQLLSARASGTPVLRIMAEPELNLRPAPRPYLQPPRVLLEPEALLPGPFPMDERQSQALLAQPVLPYLVAPAVAATGVDRQRILRRELPAPVLP